MGILGGILVKDLSVIVPIYNKEDFMEQSLNSLLNGVGKDSEILLIDDSSTDHSLLIAQDFVKMDSRVRLLKNKTNRGVSYTRNKGIKMAQGKYIGFFDADDQVDYGFYDKLCQSALDEDTNPDIIVGGFQLIDANNLCFSFPNLSILVEGYSFSLQKRKFVSRETYSCCNKIYHHTFLEGKYFPNYIKEDMYFHYWTMWSAQNVLENRKTTYYYYPKDAGRDNSYYHHPNGNFYDFIEGYQWLQQKIGSTKDFLSSFHEAQKRYFLGYMQSIVSWHIPIDDQIDLIGTMIDYCRKVHNMDLSFLDPVSLGFYQLYKEKYSDFSLDDLTKKLNVLSYNYPNQRKK